MLVSTPRTVHTVPLHSEVGEVGWSVGVRSEWGNKVELVEGVEGVGISSTRVRKAAKNQEWHVVSQLCTEAVSEWVRDQGLYSEDAEGKKMMS